MSQLNEYILAILKLILEAKEDSIILKTNDKPLLSINKKQILIAETNQEQKLVALSHTTSIISIESTLELFIKLKKYNPILNNVGIGYNVKDINKEVTYYKDIAMQSYLHLYEEESNDKILRWLFIGDVTHRQDPLYEIVLSQRSQERDIIWNPHFQIDIDTNIKDDILKKICSIEFGVDFLQWNIDIPNYGVVLEMGRLEVYDGINVWIGFGANLRNTKYHREHLKLTI